MAEGYGWVSEQMPLKSHGLASMAPCPISLYCLHFSGSLIFNRVSSHCNCCWEGSRFSIVVPPYLTSHIRFNETCLTLSTS